MEKRARLYLNLSVSWIFRELDAFISTAATWNSLEWPLFNKLGALQHPSCLDLVVMKCNADRKG